jgi:hypothetical protein
MSTVEITRYRASLFKTVFKWVELSERKDCQIFVFVFQIGEQQQLLLSSVADEREGKQKKSFSKVELELFR